MVLRLVLNGVAEAELKMKWWDIQLPHQQSSDEFLSSYNEINQIFIAPVVQSGCR
jgi:hypothetical protein